MIIQTQEPKLKVAILPAIADNYIFVLFHTETREALVVDPGDATPVLEFLQAEGLTPVSVLNTHHHWDHVDGTGGLLEAFPQCKRFAPAKNKDSLKTADHWLNGGESFNTLGTQAEVIAVPGHTLGHLAIYLPRAQVLFCGDTLFSFGCGRLFEGTPEVMWESLKKLRALPDETLVFCAHEYTLDNLKFALALDPENEDLKEVQRECVLARQNNMPTVPVSLGQQKKLNPFLRADDNGLAQRLGVEGQSPTSVFTLLRSKKDKF